MRPGHPASAALRGIAIIEAAKGLIVVLAGCSRRSAPNPARQVVISLVTRLHIDPNGREAGLFNEVADHLTNARLWGLAAMAVAYAAVRFIEGYGLWFGKRWASWLGVVGGGIYVPAEIYELTVHPTSAKFGVLLFNLAVVTFLAAQLPRCPGVAALEPAEP